jgi:hypothetical protein
MKKLLNYSKPYLRKNTKMTGCGCVDGSAASGFTTGLNNNLCNSGDSVATPTPPGVAYCTTGGVAAQSDTYCYGGSSASSAAGCSSGSGNVANIMSFDDCSTGTTFSASSSCETGGGA